MVLNSIRVQNFHYLMVAWVKMSLVLGVDMSLSLHFDNKGEDILILGRGPTQGLDDTTLIAEAKYSIYFSTSNKNCCLSLHYNGGNNFYLLMLQKCINSGDVSANNMKKKKKNRIKWVCVQFFC